MAAAVMTFGKVAQLIFFLWWHFNDFFVYVRINKILAYKLTSPLCLQTIPHRHCRNITGNEVISCEKTADDASMGIVSVASLWPYGVQAK